ncbi:MAG: hypothetical protein K9M07_05645 [Simkaniaceae bacterium]|nr:hypothetical protein [Simkaniaceae bacterium]MCF7852703.1 hypothetical protein [Simkaniaceae bacterium]
MGAIIKGTILGAIIAYVWMVVSWMVLPWHTMTYKEFKSGASVQTTIMRNIGNERAIYLFPSPKGMEREAEETAEGKQKLGAKNQIFMFAAINPSLSDAINPMTYVYAFIIQIMTAFFVTWLTKMSGIIHYVGRLFFVVGIACAAGCMIYLPFWNWWQFSNIFTAIGFADLIVTWFLAGLVIAAFTGRKTHPIGLQ